MFMLLRIRRAVSTWCVMALGNYSELKASIASWASRDDLADSMDDLIALTEARLWQTLRVRAMENRISLSGSGRFIPLPTGFLEARRVLYVNGSTRIRIEPGTPSGMKISDSSGIPREYVVTEELELNRPTTGRIELQYYRKLDPLSADDPTNGILTEYPNLYLYGCLGFAFAKAQDTEQELKWSSRFESELIGANERAKAGRFGPGKAARARGSTP